VALGRLGPKPNVLMIVSDDLRPEISPYGSTYLKTPSLQALAEEGFFFRRAYAQYPVCNPSRVSALTGRRPDVTRIFANTDPLNPTAWANFRDVPGALSWKTIPQHFKDNGYHTVAYNKIFHDMVGTSDYSFGSWSEKPHLLGRKIKSYATAAINVS